MARHFLVLLLIGVSVLGCTSLDRDAYIRDGMRYGVTSGTFRGRWWSYYERGASFASGKYYEEAASDFQTALINRSRDTWRARTYGLHFVPYFPNRELGIAYYYQGRYQEASDTLESALEMVDTARGHHYLGLTKRALIAQGALEDIDAPSVRTDLAHDSLINEHIIPFNLEASDDLGVAEVRVNDRVLAQRAPGAQVTFQERLQLAEGVHEISIAAMDLADKAHEDTLTVTVDLTGPTIGLFSPTEAEIVGAQSILIEGVCVDNHGVAEISINDRALASGDGARRVPFQTQATLAPGENVLTLTARDLAGNETRTELRVYHGDRDSVAARLWLLQQHSPELLMLAQADGSMLLAEAPEPQDRIVLNSPQKDKPYRHNRAVLVQGEVIAASGVAALRINDQPFEQLTGAPKEAFSRRIPLDDETLVEEGGLMTLAVAAEDAEGHHLEEQVEVELRPVVLNRRETKMPVATLAYPAEGKAATLAEPVRFELDGSLMDLKRFDVLNRLNLEAILTELELSASALVQARNALQSGQVQPAYVFLAVTVIPQGESGVEIKVDVIDVETSSNLTRLDGFAPNESRDAIRAACEALAAEFNRLYPRLSGELRDLQQRRNQTLLSFNWTVEDGLQEYAYVLIVEEVFDDHEVVGRARLRSITDSQSSAVLIYLEEGVELEQGMAAITM